jgi:hypothetical protein
MALVTRHLCNFACRRASFQIATSKQQQNHLSHTVPHGPVGSLNNRGSRTGTLRPRIKEVRVRSLCSTLPPSGPPPPTQPPSTKDRNAVGQLPSSNQATYKRRCEQENQSLARNRRVHKQPK